MKKSVIVLLVLSLFAIFLSVNFISALSCSVKATCDSNEVRRMGLSAATNAHGQLSSESGYSQSLCCTQGIGEALQTLSCTGANKILGLSSSTNAHAEGPAGTGYILNNVCYGFLVCRLETNQCSGDYLTEILSLSAVTNAHLGAFADYTTKICCKDNSPFINSCDLTDAGWQQATISATVPIRMMVSGNGCNNGGLEEGIDFRIYKKNFILGFWTSSTSIINISGNHPYAEWDTVQGGPYYFIAKAIGSGDTFSSLDGIGFDELTVTAEDPNACRSIDVCEDYATHSTHPEIFCNSDPDICNVAVNDLRKDPAASSFGCAWNPGNTCNFTNYYESESILCENGYTLCNTADTFADYCYRGNTCPAGQMPLDDGFGTCDAGDGCSNSFSCSNGEQDSCVEGSLCQGGMCSSGAPVVPVAGCKGGFNLCSNALGNYCYPKTGCPAGDTDILNVCIAPAVDQGGICVNTITPFGKCTFSYIDSGDNCDDGFLTYSWTSAWDGTVAQPAACNSGSATIECPAQIPLPLFTPANTIATVLAIITIYLVMALVKKSRNKKSSKSHKKKRRR